MDHVCIHASQVAVVPLCLNTIQSSSQETLVIWQNMENCKEAKDVSNLALEPALPACQEYKVMAMLQK
jgi:hypothetical protein